MWGRLVLIVLCTWMISNAIAASIVDLKNSNLTYRWVLAGISLLISFIVIPDWGGLFSKFYTHILVVRLLSILSYLLLPLI